MGTLMFSPGQIVYVDANAFIYGVERVPAYRSLLEPFARAVSAGGVRLVASELLVVEVLTGPMKARDHSLVDRYGRLLRGCAMRLLAMDYDLLRRAAELRARRTG